MSTILVLPSSQQGSSQSPLASSTPSYLPLRQGLISIIKEPEDNPHLLLTRLLEAMVVSLGGAEVTDMVRVVAATLVAVVAVIPHINHGTNSLCASCVEQTISCLRATRGLIPPTW
jgi:hypothetical protein